MVVLKEGVCREEIVGGGRSLNLPAGTYFPSTPKLNNESCVSEKKEVNLWNLPLVQRIHENIFIPSPRIKKKKKKSSCSIPLKTDVLLLHLSAELTTTPQSSLLISLNSDVVMLLL